MNEIAISNSRPIRNRYSTRTASICLVMYVHKYFAYQYFLFFRNVLGTKNLGDILSERESIANMMQSTLDEATDPWGVKVERVEVWVTYFFGCFCDLVPDLTKVVVGFKIWTSNNRNAFTNFAILHFALALLHQCYPYLLTTSLRGLKDNMATLPKTQVAAK